MNGIIRFNLLIFLLFGFERSAFTQVPINDECTGAISLNCGDTIEVITTGWTQIPANITYGDVWFSYVGDGSNVIVDVCGQSEIYSLNVVRSMTGCEDIVGLQGSGIALLDCNYINFNYSKYSFYAQENWDYFIRLRGGYSLTDTLDLHIQCLGEPEFGCNVEGACNYNPSGEWMNFGCDFASCLSCGTDSNYVQLFIPAPFTLGGSGGSNYSYDCDVLNSEGQLVLTIPDICVNPNDIEMNCEQGTDDVFLIGGMYYRKELFCLPNDCYSIEFNGWFYSYGPPWFLGLPGQGNVISGYIGDTHTFCVEPIMGCMDPLALNFNENAQSPGMCIYPGDFDENGSIGISDLMLFISAFACTENCEIFDLNGDELVNVGDLIIFMSYL